LAQSVPLCDNTANSILRVYVRNAVGEGITGVEVVVTWPGGEDRFYTGLKPKIDPGYADFYMDINQTYNVTISSSNAAIAENVNAEATSRCTNLAPNTGPSWQIVFQQEGTAPTQE
jgi:hypothetical protein